MPPRLHELGFRSTLPAVSRITMAGTAHTSFYWALDANWGTGATVLLGNCNDLAGEVVVMSGNAAVGPNPTVTLTFADGAYPSAPLVMVFPRGINGATDWSELASTTTTAGFRFNGTPAITTGYFFNYLILGRP